MQYTHTCSCGEQYTSDDVDPYFCPTCVDNRKRIAAEVDAKVGERLRGKKVMSSMERYDSLPKIRGFISAADL